MPVSPRHSCFGSWTKPHPDYRWKQPSIVEKVIANRFSLQSVARRWSMSRWCTCRRYWSRWKKPQWPWLFLESERCDLFLRIGSIDRRDSHRWTDKRLDCQSMYHRTRTLFERQNRIASCIRRESDPETNHWQQTIALADWRWVKERKMSPEGNWTTIDSTRRFPRTCCMPMVDHWKRSFEPDCTVNSTCNSSGCRWLEFGIVERNLVRWWSSIDSCCSWLFRAVAVEDQRWDIERNGQANTKHYSRCSHNGFESNQDKFTEKE